MFALSGAHRTGKTSLAKALSERLGIPYLDCNVTPELEAAGYDQVAALSLEMRLACQEKRLELHMAKIESAPRPCITDRSPLDLAAYTIAEFNMHSDPGLAAQAQSYVQRCINLTMIHHDTIIAVRPLPFFTVEEGKPPPNVGFQWHIQHLVEGFMVVASKIVQPVFLDITEFDARVAGASNVIAQRLQAMSEWREAVTSH